MKIRVLKHIADDKFLLDITTEDFSQGDLNLIQKFGEPQVNVGGLYGNPDDATRTWIVPDSLLNVRQDFQPFRASFDQRTYSDAAARASALAAVIVTRIEDAMTTLRSLTDTFTGESVTNV